LLLGSACGGGVQAEKTARPILEEGRKKKKKRGPLYNPQNPLQWGKKKDTPRAPVRPGRRVEKAKLLK